MESGVASIHLKEYINVWINSKSFKYIIYNAGHNKCYTVKGFLQGSVTFIMSCIVDVEDKTDIYRNIIDVANQF